MDVEQDMKMHLAVQGPGSEVVLMIMPTISLVSLKIKKAVK